MIRTTVRAATAAVALLPVAATAQAMDPHMHMPGMKMDMPMKAKPKVAHRAPSHARSPSPANAGVQSQEAGDETSSSKTPHPETGPRPAPGKEDQGTGDPAAMPEMAMPEHQGHAMPGMALPAQGHDMPGMTMSAGDMAGMTMMGGAYGEGSGTARNPAVGGAMHGVHVMVGEWALMLHGYAWGVYTDQGGPRGANEAFVQSMAMLSASRDLGDITHLQLRSMLSLEPLMGAKGYPNLFATGETADGRTQLVDRQHPHDLFMELSGRVDIDAGSGSAFLYGGPVAEPALGPSAFMHRPSAAYAPLAPITHHWFDSTHITYGVVTAGYAAPKWQLEASAFRGREPDQHRWDIERPSLDSWSVRATWTPTPAWAIQASHGFLKSPEQLEPERNEARTTASVQYGRGGVSTTLAFSAKHPLPGPTLTAWLAEANWDIDRHHTVFGRFENVANDELFPEPASPLDDRKFRVSKLEGGYAYRMPLAGPLALALGGAVGVYAKPDALDAAYGYFPVSVSLFAKVSLGH